MDTLDFYEIGNFYGHLQVREGGGEYFWAIEDQNNIAWKPIPKFLYDALVKYHTEHKEHRKILSEK